MESTNVRTAAQFSLELSLKKNLSTINHTGCHNGITCRPDFATRNHVKLLTSKVKRRTNVKGISAGADTLLLAPSGRPHRLSHR